MFTSIWKEIRNGNLSPVYLLMGEEGYFIEETISRLRNRLSAEGDLEEMSFDLEEIPVEAVIEEADTFPFFSERKLILAKNASFLKAAEKNKVKVEHDLKALERWLEHPSTTAVTVFVAPYEKLDERKKITKLMKEKSVVAVGKALQEQELVQWVVQEASKRGKTISKELALKLIDITGLDMIRLQAEIEKMSLYLGEEKEITSSIIEEMVARTLEQDAFKMLNAYLTGDTETALSVYHDLIRQKEEPIMLTSLLASQIRLMHHVFFLKKKGYHQQQIAKQLKVHPYRVKLLLDSTLRINENKLIEVMKKLADVDLKLKTVSGNRDRILELVLMQKISS
ncbi:DNA polymerase III subunit delta [Chungangia koreensis]|uniref:DNA polymerase III subunit delta n=1 Tax=Chungangia koreensis TaxID=752657 RepID=A0ABV8X564_9LACT